MAQQTAVDWLVNHWKKLQSKGEKMSWQQIIDITELAKQMEKEQRIKNITDYNIKVTEFLLDPLFNLEHSKHGIACEKLADIRNEFIKKL